MNRCVRADAFADETRGLSHGVAVSPADNCGTAGAFVVDVKLCSTEKAAAFFGLMAAPPAPPSSSPEAAPGKPAGTPDQDVATHHDACAD